MNFISHIINKEFNGSQKYNITDANTEGCWKNIKEVKKK